MDGPTLIRYVHLLAAFVFVAALFATHWNVLAARRTADWRPRAVLFELNARTARLFALPSLLVIGFAGNVLAMQLGYRMADTPTFRIVNVLWLLQLVTLVVIELSAAGKLAALARAAANAADRREGNGSDPVEWRPLLGRWRAGNALQLALFVGTLFLMARPWR